MQKNCDTCKYGEFGNVKCVDCVSTTRATHSHWESADFYEPDSNAARIREMSDEELAKQLVVTLTGGPITMYLALNNGTSYLSKKFATEKVLEWLQQPAEVPEYA